MGLAAIGATSTGQWFTQEVGGFDLSPALTSETALPSSTALVTASQGAGRTELRTMRAAGALHAGLVERAAFDGPLSVAAQGGGAGAYAERRILRGASSIDRLAGALLAELAWLAVLGEPPATSADFAAAWGCAAGPIRWTASLDGGGTKSLVADLIGRTLLHRPRSVFAKASAAAVDTDRRVVSGAGEGLAHVATAARWRQAVDEMPDPIAVTELHGKPCTDPIAGRARHLTAPAKTTLRTGASNPARPAARDRVQSGLATIGRVAIAVAKARVASPQSTGAAGAQSRGILERTRLATRAAVGDGGQRSLAAVGGVAVAVAKAGVASPQSTGAARTQSRGIGESTRLPTRPAVGNCIDGGFTAIGRVVVAIFESSRAALTLVVYTACPASAGRTDTTIWVAY